jgi:hypothetical protein
MMLLTGLTTLNGCDMKILKTVHTKLLSKDDKTLQVCLQLRDISSLGYPADFPTAV